MSQENMDILRTMFEASRGEDPNVEWDTRSRGADGEKVRGRERARAATEGWLDAWEGLRFEVVRAVDADDSIAAWFRQSAQGKVSGVRGDLEWWAVFRFRDGKLTHYREYANWTQALEAVGLRE